MSGVMFHDTITALPIYPAVKKEIEKRTTAWTLETSSPPNIDVYNGEILIDMWSMLKVNGMT